jgi:hypothetical protein
MSQNSKTGIVSKFSEEERNKFRDIRRTFVKKIKEMEATQREYKRLRSPKEINISEVPSLQLMGILGISDAQSLAAHFGYALRHTYIAYAVFRNKKVIGRLERNPFDHSNGNPFYVSVVAYTLKRFGIEVSQYDLLKIFNEESKQNSNVPPAFVFFRF